MRLSMYIYNSSEVTSQCKLFVSKVKQVIEDQDHLKKIHLYEEMEFPQITAVFETLNDLQYKHVQSIRLKSN
jgi:hypothetical protein